MQLKDLYYQKYLKYKNKYVNLQSALLIRDALKKKLEGTQISLLKRQKSQVCGFQGEQGTCSIHATGSLLGRLIKYKFSKYFSQDIEICNFYYDTIKCSIFGDNTIFDCFLQIKNGKADCMSKCIKSEEPILTIVKTWENENISALLFHFIYSILTFRLGLCGTKITLSNLYILDYLKYTDITPELIKSILNYNKDKYDQETNEYFNILIDSLVNIFKDVRENLVNGRFKPTFYIGYNKHFYSVSKYQYYEKIDEFNNMLFIPTDELRIPQNLFNDIIVHYSENNKLFDIFKTDNFVLSLKHVLNEGFYALFQKDDHVITITGLDKDNLHLNVKNTWGDDLCAMKDEKNWCKLVRNNKININELLEWKEYFYIIFIYPEENAINYQINKLINKEEIIIENLNDNQVTILLNKITKNMILKTLEISDSIFSNDNYLKLSQLLQKKITLKKLNLTLNKGIEGIELIAKALETNTTLTELYIIGNKFGDNGAVAIAEALKQNKTLTILALDENKIGIQGAEAIAEALKKNKTLTTLILDENKIGIQGTEAIAEALKENKTLNELQLSSNKIGVQGAEAIAKVLETNTTLTIITLRSNKIGIEGAIVIAKALETNTSLKTLDLYNNKIGDEGAEAIAKALVTNKYSLLTTLNLGWNQISEEEFKAFALITNLKLNMNF